MSGHLFAYNCVDSSIGVLVCCCLSYNRMGLILYAVVFVINQNEWKHQPTSSLYDHQHALWHHLIDLNAYIYCSLTLCIKKRRNKSRNAQALSLYRSINWKKEAEIMNEWMKVTWMHFHFLLHTFNFENDLSISLYCLSYIVNCIMSMNTTRLTRKIWV